MKFRIKYQNKDHSIGTFDLDARSGQEAKQFFSDRYASQIINVDNLTVKDNSYAVAKILLSSAKYSSNSRIQQVAKLANPAAALAEQLVDQFLHVINGDQFDDVHDMAKEVWIRMVK